MFWLSIFFSDVSVFYRILMSNRLFYGSERENQVCCYRPWRTLLRDDKTISVADYNSLVGLGNLNVRVAATGRSLHKVYEVLSLILLSILLLFRPGQEFSTGRNSSCYLPSNSMDSFFQLCSFFINWESIFWYLNLYLTITSFTIIGEKAFVPNLKIIW